MRNDVRKPLLLLASSSLSTAELRNLASWIEDQGNRAFVASIIELREFQPGVDKRKPIGTYDAQLIEKVKTLLLQEAALTKAEAAARLHAALSRKLRIDDLPRYARSGFDRWLLDVSRLVPASLLLNQATLIRNGLIHSKSDWSLNVEKD